MAPPRKLVLHKFAEARSSELEALHSVVSNRLNDDFRSQRHKRRRTTSYNNQATKKKKRRRAPILGVGLGGDAKTDLKKNDKVSRRVRRRIELKKNPESGFTASGDGTKRLRTHIWHAKRFRMTKIWGFHLPLHVHGSGRGTRALLQRLKNGVVVHDASYHVPVQLEGSEVGIQKFFGFDDIICLDSLLAVLNMVLSPSPSTQSEDISRLVRSGIIYGSAMLCHVGGPPIAPVTYMWRTSKKKTTGGDNGCEHDSGGCEEQLKIDGSSQGHQLWVWIHGSAYRDAFDALKFTCQRQMHERSEMIDCCSLEGQFAKFQVIGSKAFQLLQKILQPVSGISENSCQLNNCSVADAVNNSLARKFYFPDNEEHITPSAILSCAVKDPRTLPRKIIVDDPESDITNLPEDEPDGYAAVSRTPKENEEVIISSVSTPEKSGTLDDDTLWDASSRLNIPVEDSVLCNEKHRRRMDFLCLDDSESKLFNPSIKVQFTRTCPILLLKNCDPKGSGIGWSIILPLSWAKVFWIPLVSNGAHAIGLQEKRQIASEVGLPYFPLDFPDCSTCSSYALAKAESLSEEEKKCPVSVRPFRIPTLTPWNSIPTRFDIGSPEQREISISMEKDVADGNFLSETTVGLPNNFFKGIVPRKSIELTNYLHEIHCEHLPLFPRDANRKVDFLNCIKESKINGITHSLYDRKLCFVRVVLHAFKEGVFEDGAVVCAPHISDISLLTSSIEGGFQIPESSVRSYWKEKEQYSGEWELQIPEDPSLRVSHRWPIGFIATGFIRGSKKPMAVAFCDAVLLANLRTEQWNSVAVKKRKKEVYVLVRNLRSSAYRLALATIVLELQEEDIGYM
ncbi:hypothetical protein ACFE04_018863 [Oxalis oulophora]